jgi:hydroxylaminobenzene mutase
MENQKRRLLWHGSFLFLLGLIMGLVEQKFTNPRMGLAAHLEGLMNGTFLIAVGAVWNELRLSERAASLAFWTAVYGSYANIATTTFAAVAGTAAFTPVTSEGHHGVRWQEFAVAAGFVSVGVTMLVASGLLLWGFGRKSRLSPYS